MILREISLSNSAGEAGPLFQPRQASVSFGETSMRFNPNPLEIRIEIKRYGVWYALWRHGFSNLWPIFVATRLK